MLIWLVGNNLYLEIHNCIILLIKAWIIRKNSLPPFAALLIKCFFLPSKKLIPRHSNGTNLAPCSIPLSSIMKKFYNTCSLSIPILLISPHHPLSKGDKYLLSKKPKSKMIIPSANQAVSIPVKHSEEKEPEWWSWKEKIS